MTNFTRAGRRKAKALRLVIPVLLFALSGCATSAAGTDSASSGGDAVSGSGGTTTLAEWQLQYAECLRGEGIDVADPDTDGGGMAMNLSETDMDAIQAAGEKCRAELGDPPPPSEKEKAEAEQQFLEWGRKAAQCYRDNGYEMADPKPGETPSFPEDASEAVQAECGGAGSLTKRAG